jgi:hypothetical protein
VRVVKYSSLDVLPESYGQLFEKGAEEWYDYSLPWFQNFVRTAMDEGDEIRIYGAENQAAPHEPIAALAMRHKKNSGGLFSPKQLSSLANFYTITFSPVGNLSAENVRDVLPSLAKSIVSDDPRWDVVELRPLDLHSFLYPALVEAFRAAGMVVQTYFCFGNWYLPVQNLTFNDYFKTLPSAMQNTIKRKTKKLEKTGRSRIEIIAGPEGLENAIASYENIYLSSWKRPEPYPHFVPGLIRAFAERNWVRMGIVYLDDQPIAGQVWIVNSGKATIYKLGHDQKFDEYSAGSILTTRMIQHVLDNDNVHEIDFGSGDDPYKKNWLPKRRERWGILAMNPRTLPGCIAIAQHVGGRAAKSAWRSVKLRLPKRNTSTERAVSPGAAPESSATQA